MIHKQHAKEFVPPEEEIDIEEELLQRIEDDPQGVYRGLAERLDALTYARNRLAEITEGSQRIKEGLETIVQQHGAELLEQQETLRAETKEISEEIKTLSEEAIPTFEMLSGNSYTAYVKVGEVQRKVKILLGRLQEIHGRISYKELSEHLQEMMQELDPTLDQEFFDSLKSQFRKATEDLGPMLKITSARYQRTHHAGLLDRIWDWLQGLWGRIRDGLARLFNTTDEAVERAEAAEAAVDKVLELTQDL